MSRRMVLGFLVMALLLPALAMAQDQPGGGQGGQGGGRGGRGGFDPAQMRQRMNDYVKQQMGATDDEWKVIQPKLEKVQQVQRDARSGGFGFGGRGGRGPGGGDAANQPEQSAVQKAAAELRTALENKDTPADQIKAKLTALREAKAKAKADLEAAQKDLKEILTARQEAVLVQMGTLE